MIKRAILIACVVVLAGCGYKSRDNTVSGQVKKVIHRTPFLCPDYTVADVSLGILKNGVGSMSNQDIILVVKENTVVKPGDMITLTYDVRRISWCSPREHVTKIEAYE